MKTVIRFTSTQKPDGKEYKKITYWNRFVRTKIETLILIALVIVSISCAAYRLTTGTMDTFWAIICIVFLFYPFLIITQFNSSIRYHLKHRDPAETSPCEFCLMENGILIDVPECDVHSFIRYDEFTHVYTNVFGFYMMFQKNKVLAMIRHSDIPQGRSDDFEDMMFSGLNDSCKVSKFM
jgi:hypothetical protein